MNKASIESIIEEGNFFIIIESTNNIKFKLPLPLLTSCRGAQYYETKYIDHFIEHLNDNTEASFNLVTPKDLNVVLDMLHIQFIFDNVVITLANTEQNREYLIIILQKFIDYLYDLCLRM